MKTRFPAALLLLCTLALVWLPSRASAQFSFTLDPTTVTGAPGGTVTFFGTLTNSGSSEISYDLFTENFALLSGPAGADLTANPVSLNSFLGPATLAPGTTTAVPLFSLDVDPSTPLGLYGGNFLVSYGGSTAGQDLSVTVAAPQAVPEAGTGLTLALGLLCLAPLLMRRVKAAVPMGTAG